MRLDEFSGFPFPAVRRGPQGCLLYTQANTKELVKASIIQILMTAPGERPWSPEFGCDVHRFLFEPANSSNVETIANLCLSALQRWEPRVQVGINDIEVAESLVSEGSVDISINYKILTTATPSRESLTITI